MIKRKLIGAILSRKKRLQFSQVRGYGPYFDCNDRTRSIFIHIPKVAGKSIVSSIYDRDFIGHYSYEDYKICDQSKFESYFKFSFVRNPYDRLVSSYKYLKSGGNQKDDLFFYKKNTAIFESFDTFVNAVHAKRDEFLWVHLLPQSHFIVNRDKEIIVDFLGRFESLERDFQEVCRILNRPNPLKKVNTSTPSGSYSGFYSDKTAEMAYEAYKEDFINFNYAKEINAK